MISHKVKLHLCDFRRILVRVVCFAVVSSSFVIAQGAGPISKAWELLKQGRLDKALEILDSLTSTGPEPKGAEYLRGLVLYQKDDMQSAATAFAKAAAQDPSDIEAMKMEGASLFREGKAAEAIPLLEQSRSSAYELNVDPQYVLGLCYLDTGRYDDARHAFALQYDFSPDSAQAFLLEGRMLIRRGALPPAERAARMALVLNHDLPMAHFLLGQIALAQGNLPEAVSQFVMERNLNPMDGTVYDRLGDAYIRIGDYTNAQKSLNRAVLLEPSLNIPYILLGKVMLEQGDPFMAARYLTHAIDIDSKNIMAHGLLGRAYRSLGRQEDAVVELRTAAKLQEMDTQGKDQGK